MLFKSAVSALSRRQSHRVFSRSFASKEIKFGVEGRASMLAGVDLLADAVQVSYFLECRLHASTFFLLQS